MSQQRVDVDGEIDAGFTSYWPPDENGETVAGTSADDKGELRDELWPTEATPREELNDDQIQVIETAAHPAAAFESLSELSRTAAPDMGSQYAGDVLRRHWPEKHDEIRVDRDSETVYTCDCGREFENAGAYGGHTRHCEGSAEEPADTPTAEEGLSITEEYDIDDPAGPTAEYPPRTPEQRDAFDRRDKGGRGGGLFALGVALVAFGLGWVLGGDSA